MSPFLTKLHLFVTKVGIISLTVLLVSCTAKIQTTSKDFSDSFSDPEEYLMTAIQYNNIPTVMRLIEEKLVDVNAKDNTGRTALMHAAINERLLIAEYLFQQGADPLLQDSWQYSAPVYAWESNNKDMISLILKNMPDLNIPDLWGQTPLHLAICWNYHDVAMWLFNHGVDLDLQDNEGQSALILTIRCYNPPLAKELLKRGANPDLQDENGDTALHYAIIYFRPELISMLLESGARTDLFNLENQTPLMMAIDYEYLDLISLFLINGANLNVQDQSGQTALMKAIVGKQYNIAKLLIQKGASLNQPDNSGRTALIMASETWSEKAVKQLRELSNGK